MKENPSLKQNDPMYCSKYSHNSSQLLSFYKALELSTQTFTVLGFDYCD